MEKAHQKKKKKTENNPHKGWRKTHVARQNRAHGENWVFSKIFITTT